MGSQMELEEGDSERVIEDRFNTNRAGVSVREYCTVFRTEVNK